MTRKTSYREYFTEERIEDIMTRCSLIENSMVLGKYIKDDLNIRQALDDIQEMLFNNFQELLKSIEEQIQIYHFIEANNDL
jgi:hypothetical protein